MARFSFSRVSDYRSRALIFGGVNLGILWVLYMFALSPLFAFFKEQGDLLERRSQTLNRFQMVLDRAKFQGKDTSIPIRKQLEFIERADDGIIDASLQTLLKQKIEGTGSHLSSMGTLPSKTIDGIRYAAAHLEFVGSLGDVQAAVHAIETNVPYLFIESARFSGPSSGGSLLSDAASMDIQAQIDVYCGVGGD